MTSRSPYSFLQRSVVLPLCSALVLTWVGCSPAPEPTTPASAAVQEPQQVGPTLEELQAELEQLEAKIERIEAAREVWIEEALERRSLALQEEDALQLSLDAALRQVDVLEKQQRLKQRQLEQHQREQQEGEDGLLEGELEQARQEMEVLEAERSELVEEQRRQQERLTQLRQRLEPLRDLDGGELFRLETLDLYRRATQLQNEIYRRLIERTASFIRSPSRQDAFTRLYQERIDQRQETLRDDDLDDERFRAFVSEFQRDRNLGAALLSSRAFQFEFKLGRAEIIETQMADFRSLAEALLEAGRRDFDYLVFIDGHADSVTYPGGACQSAQLNRDLSQRRAEAARDLLVEFGLPEQRLRLDWFGNFSMVAPPSNHPQGEVENRRVEVRVTSREAGEYTSHRDYFGMRRQLPLLERAFARDIGRWVDVECRQRPAASTWPYLGQEYQRWAETTELDARQPVFVEDEAREYLLGIGNDVTLQVEGRCIRIRGCDSAAVDLPAASSDPLSGEP